MSNKIVEEDTPLVFSYLYLTFCDDHRNRMDLLWHIVNHIQLIHIASMTRRKEILFISVNSTLHKGTMPTVQGFTVRQLYTVYCSLIPLSYTCSGSPEGQARCAKVVFIWETFKRYMVVFILRRSSIMIN